MVATNNMLMSLRNRGNQPHTFQPKISYSSINRERDGRFKTVDLIWDDGRIKGRKNDSSRKNSNESDSDSDYVDADNNTT